MRFAHGGRHQLHGQRFEDQPLTDPVILAEGDGWLAVAKPPGVVVHRGPRTLHERAMLQRVRDLVRRRVYPIHRLDRPASGVLLFASRREVAGPLHGSLRAEDAVKTYLAFVRGHVVGEGPVVVETPMKDDNGVLKDARSVVWCVGTSADPRCSLLRVQPQTGRFHQVRRHVRDLSHPIVGDADHGDSRINRWWRENHGVRRLGLHALSIELTPPEGGRVRIVCPLFADQHALYRQMPWWEQALAAQPELGLEPLPLPGSEE